MTAATNLWNVANAYGGHVAGPIAAWTGLCVFFLTFVLFTIRSGQLGRVKQIVAGLCLSWVIHGLIIWYTVVELMGLFMITELHIGRAAWRHELFGMVDGCTRFALISTLSLVLATILSTFGFRHPTTTEPDQSSSPDSSITGTNAPPTG
jgi:hypothetical protein